MVDGALEILLDHESWQRRLTNFRTANNLGIPQLINCNLYRRAAHRIKLSHGLNYGITSYWRIVYDIVDAIRR